jgi:hypothetical protein
MKSTKDSEVKIAYGMGQSWGSQMIAVAIGIVLCMLLVWITLPTPEERLLNKACFKQCKTKVERDGHTMSFLSSRDYIEAMKECHQECANREK